VKRAVGSWGRYDSENRSGAVGVVGPWGRYDSENRSGAVGVAGAARFNKLSGGAVGSWGRYNSENFYKKDENRGGRGRRGGVFPKTALCFSLKKGP
jgi:hypothetical protein